MKHWVFEKNTVGRDFFISDIHGHKRKFERALERVDFSPENGDRLFCLGDLIDRGEDNLQILGKLKHWNHFYSIIGNHEKMLIDQYNVASTDLDMFGCDQSTNVHSMNGGKWFYKTKKATRDRVYQQIKELPTTIEVKTAYGNIGLVHAEVPIGYNSWETFVNDLQTDADVLKSALWGRRVIKTARSYEQAGLTHLAELAVPLEGIDLVLHGHTTVKAPKVIGNRIYIDTGFATGEHTIMSAQEVMALLAQNQRKVD